MKNLRAILFDFDGTLVHSIDLLVQIFTECFIEAGFNSINRDAVRRMIGEPLEEIFRQLTGITNVEKLCVNFRQKEDARHTATEIQLVSGTIPALEFLRARGLKLGIVSTKRRKLVEPLAAELAIGQFFEVVVGGSDVEKPKPDPAATLLACEKLGVEPAATLFVGDSLLDLRSARTAGCTFVGVLTGTATEKDFRQNRADYILKNVGEIPKLLIASGKLF